MEESTEQDGALKCIFRTMDVVLNPSSEILNPIGYQNFAPRAAWMVPVTRDITGTLTGYLHGGRYDRCHDEAERRLGEFIITRADLGTYRFRKGKRRKGRRDPHYEIALNLAGRARLQERERAVKKLRDELFESGWGK